MEIHGYLINLYLYFFLFVVDVVSLNGIYTSNVIPLQAYNLHHTTYIYIYSSFIGHVYECANVGPSK